MKTPVFVLDLVIVTRSAVVSAVPQVMNVQRAQNKGQCCHSLSIQQRRVYQQPDMNYKKLSQIKAKSI
ncbi:hypothetical protein L6232_01740 [Shewanella sp. C31]|nr:hypothetical protein [Shewanella electrica]